MKQNIIPITLIAFFSVLLWGSVSLSEEYFTTINMPVKLVDIPEGMALADYSPKMVSVNVKGEGWQLAGMTYGRDLDFMVSIGNKTGLSELELDRAAEKNGWKSSSIQLVDIKPSKLQYVIEDMIYKKVAVVPDLEVGYKAGYDLVSEIRVYPDSVEIRGPASIVNQMESISTVLTSLTKLSKPVSNTISLNNSEAVTSNPEQVIVEFDVQKIVDKVFDDVVVDTRNVPSFRELGLFPGKIKIVLRGGINTLGKLTSDDLSPYVTFKQAISDTSGLISPSFAPPEFTKLIDIKPHQLEYIIKKY